MINSSTKSKIRNNGCALEGIGNYVKSNFGIEKWDTSHVADRKWVADGWCGDFHFPHSHNCTYKIRGNSRDYFCEGEDLTGICFGNQSVTIYNQNNTSSIKIKQKIVDWCVL